MTDHEWRDPYRQHGYPDYPVLEDAVPPPRPRLQPKLPLIVASVLVLVLGVGFAARQLWDPCFPFPTDGPHDPRSYAGTACNVNLDSGVGAFSTFPEMLAQFHIDLPAQAENVRFLFEDHSAFNGTDYVLYLRFTAPHSTVHAYVTALGDTPQPATLVGTAGDIGMQQDMPALGADWAFLFGFAVAPPHIEVYGWGTYPSQIGGPAVVVVDSGAKPTIYTVAAVG